MRWLNYTSECSISSQFISHAPPPPHCFLPTRVLLIFTISFQSGISHLFLINPLHLHYLLGPLGSSPSVPPSFHFLSVALQRAALDWPDHPRDDFFFLFFQWPCSQAGGLYLVRRMIKSAGLTSASDRPIHPTDTPPPPHTGWLNNLCTISNMKEDLLTLRSPPAPSSNLSLDC